MKKETIRKLNNAMPYIYLIGFAIMGGIIYYAEFLSGK